MHTYPYALNFGISSGAVRMKHQASKDLVLEKFQQANEQMEGIMILFMIEQYQLK